MCIKKIGMKKLILISVAVIICLSFAGISVYSAENKNTGFIFEYKKELVLTDKQEQNLKDILSKFQNYVSDKQKQLNRLQTELSKMIAERAALAKIKAKINDIFKIQAEVNYEGVVSTRAIENELTAAQLDKWRVIQEEFAKNYQQAQNVSKTQEIKK
jgi:Spy/CpxP family protein refolding chaperone